MRPPLGWGGHLDRAPFPPRWWITPVLFLCPTPCHGCASLISRPPKPHVTPETATSGSVSGSSSWGLGDRAPQKDPGAWGIMTRVWLLLFLQLRLSREEAAYARKGRARLLSCGLDRPLANEERLTWSFQRPSPPTSVTLFLAVGGRAPERLADAWGRLNLLQNYSLQLQAAEDGDTGTYWCSVGNDNHNSYQLVVVTGTHMLQTHGPANTTCHLLSCVFSAPLESPLQEALEWLADGQTVTEDSVQDGYRLFWGSREALLRVCKRSNPRKKNRLSCRIKNTKMIFDLARLEAARDSPACDPEGPPGSSAWIPLAVCAALEFLLLVAIGAALWRQRQPPPGSQLGDHPTHPRPDPSGPKSQMQLYENVGPRGTGDLAQL